MLNRRQSILDACVHGGVIEFVLAVVGKKEFEALPDKRFVDYLSAERALNQDGRSVAYVAGNHFVGQLRPANVAEGGVYGVHQIETGVDQRAATNEAHALHCREGDVAEETHPVLY